MCDVSPGPCLNRDEDSCSAAETHLAYKEHVRVSN